MACSQISLRILSLRAATTFAVVSKAVLSIPRTVPEGDFIGTQDQDYEMGGGGLGWG